MTLRQVFICLRPRNPIPPFLTACSVQRAEYGLRVHRVVCSVQCELCSVQGAVCSTQRSVYKVFCHVPCALSSLLCATCRLQCAV
jgi:hypothetical protein